MNEMVLENMLLFCEEDQILRNVVSGASGDIGDLGFLLPAVQIGFSGIKGQFHNDNFTIADKENCYIRTAKVLAGTTLTCCKSQCISLRILRQKKKNT